MTVDRERQRELLRACPYFAGLADNLLDDVLWVVNVRRFRRGQRIFSEGDGEGVAALYIVESGTVRVFKVSLQGREQVLHLLRPGDSFADVPALDGGPYPANAEALDPTVVLTLPRAALLGLMRRHPEIALGTAQIMAARLRRMTGLVEDLSLRRVVSRVARLLQADQENANLSQSQMATMVGSTREMVNRSLQTLADTGAINVHRKRIIVNDADKLAQIAESE